MANLEDFLSASLTPAVPKARAALRGAPNAPGARSERHDGVVPGGLREFRAVRARLQEPLRPLRDIKRLREAGAEA